MAIEIKILGSSIDLFRDETIQLSKTVKEFRELSSSKVNYTQSFTVPASPFNNALFGLYYKGESVGTFDHRVKHNASIFNSGTLVSHGSIELESATMKNNEPYSYTLSFFGEGVKLAENFSDVKLNQLDFSHLAHYYNSDNVRIGATGGATGSEQIKNIQGNDISREDLTYPLITGTQKLYYNSAVGDFNPDNIHYNPNPTAGSEHGVNLSGLKPAVSFPAIMSAINANLLTPNVTSPLFSQRRFKELYMWCNPTEGLLFGESTRPPSQKLAGQSGNFPLWDFTNQWFIADRSRSHDITLSGAATASGAPYYFIVKQNGGEIHRQFITGNSDFFLVPLTEGATIEFFVEAFGSESFTLNNLDINISVSGGGAPVSGNVRIATTNYLLTVDPTDLISGMSVGDFLNGLVKMFNLVVEVDDLGQLVLTPYNDWISGGTELDLTRYIDTSSSKITTTELFSKLEFKHKELETATNKAFKDYFNRDYGNLEAILNIKEKDDFQVETPFTNLLFERQYDENSTSGKGKLNISTGAMLTFSEGGEVSGVAGDPLIFYCSPNPIRIADEAGLNTISMVSIDGSTEYEVTRVHLCNNSTYTSVPADVQLQYSVNWGDDIDPYYETAIQNHLYRMGYQDYLTSVYEETSRFIEVEMFLPIAVGSTLRMNDTIIIRGRKYAIDQFSVTLNTGRVKAKLRSFKTPTILQFKEGDSTII
jgi:hypothetical protein